MVASVYEAFSLGDRTITGKVIGDFTIDFCKTMAGAAVSQSGMTLTELGVGVYVLMNPNITERTVVSLYLTSDSTKTAAILMDPVDGDIAKQSTLSAGVTLLPSEIVQGVLSTVLTSSEGTPFVVIRGDASRLSVSLGSAYAKAGAKFYLCVKADNTGLDATAIVNREITISDAVNVDGYIDLTTAETATIGSYYAEIERRDSDGTSNPLTCWQGNIVIRQDVRKGA